MIKLITLLLACSIPYFSLYSFNPKKLISNMWQKTEQELFQKDEPLEDKSTIEINGIEGKVSIKSWSQKKMIIEAEKVGTQEELKNTTIGVKKSKMAQSSATHVTITTRVASDKKAAAVNYNLMVPEQCSIIVRLSQKGAVKIKHMQGRVDISTLEGDIEITDSTSSVAAKTGKGSIKLKQKKFSDASSILLESGRGSIYLHLARDTKATLHARTLQGVVTSEHPISRTSFPEKQNKESWERIKREIDGTLAGGGAPITLESTRGTITIEEY